jgi:Sulfotransferase family
MTRRKPNLFLIGAMKAGTRYLRKLLKAHPDIFMCEPAEPSYFVDPRHLRRIYPEMWQRGLWRSEERYLELFRPAGDAPILGEASTGYTKLPLAPGVVERIAAFNPDARLIYLLRDPVDRAISHYWHMVRHHAERRPIADAFRRDAQFVAFSHYAMQLRPYLGRFGRGRIAVVIYERLIADPAGVMRGVYEWLEVDAAAVDPSVFAEPENVGPEMVSMAGWGGVPRRLGQAPRLRGAIERLPPAVQRTLHRLTTREVSRRAVDATEAVAFLRPQQLRQTEELAQLLGCSFREWTTLHGKPSPTTRLG